MFELYDVIAMGGVFCNFIISYILFTRHSFQLHANRLLAVPIFGFGFYVLAHLVIESGWLIHLPWMFRLGSPLYYLIGPCSFLYVRSITRDETRFRKWDWLHFLPAMIHFIELLPFYFANAEEKRQVITAVNRNFNNALRMGHGLIRNEFHFAIRPIQGFIYLGFTWRLLVISLSGKNRYNISSASFHRIKKWLIVFCIFVTILFLGMATQAFFGLTNKAADVSAIDARRMMRLFLALCFFCFSIYLFFKPDILYGVLFTNALPGSPASADTQTGHGPGRSKPVPLKNIPKSPRRETLLDADVVSAYAKRIEDHLAVHKSFLKQGITASELAVEMKVPVHHLSYVLNCHYKKRFTDFINEQRVSYVRRQFHDTGWKRLKLEAIAGEAGFSSRSTFFAAFKKVMGITPSEYARQYLKDQPTPPENMS